mmetsp:Transcript_3117/g.3694  ORF Transcript_3117/g.3694 Transcript_3117/m.3694 type:complete len:341 (-) Transcript_3117:510-1532(-)
MADLPPPIKNVQLNRRGSLFRVGSFVLLALMIGGSNMVTVSKIKKIKNMHNIIHQTTTIKMYLLLNQTSDTSVNIRTSHEVDDWANDIVCSKPLEPIISSNLGGNNPKYINVGMPKSGSTSITHLFKMAGITNCHYDNCKKNHPKNKNKNKKRACGVCIKDIIDNHRQRNIFSECGDFTMWGEMNIIEEKACIFPQIKYLENIYTDAPHATWIMPMRNVSDWLDSVSKWGHYPGEFRNQFRLCNFQQIGFNGSTDAMDDRKMMAMYCNHIVQIREFVKSHPTLSLIEFRIEDPNVGKFLESLLPIDAADWGKQNVMDESRQKKFADIRKKRQDKKIKRQK